MEPWYIDIAGQVVRITGSREEIFSEPGLLAPFVTRGPAYQWSLDLKITDVLPRPGGECIFSGPDRRVYRLEEGIATHIGAGEPYLVTLRRGNDIRALVRRSALPGKIPAKVALTALEAEHLVACAGGFLLHAACICVDGEAILFTAPSGTGKSTQAQLWHSLRGAEIINGDRIVVRPGQAGLEALGIPFSGSSGIRKNRRMPVKAIFYLSQAKENTVQPLTGLRAFRHLWEGCSVHTWDPEDLRRCADAVQAAVRTGRVYALACTPDVRAVEAAEAAMETGGSHGN